MERQKERTKENVYINLGIYIMSSVSYRTTPVCTLQLLTYLTNYIFHDKIHKRYVQYIVNLLSNASILIIH